MLFKRKVGDHLSENAKQAIASTRGFPPVEAFRNPVTREVTRKLIHAEWHKLLALIDFPFELEDCRVNGVPCTKYTTQATTADGPLVLYIHGGGFLAGSPRANAATILPVLQLSGATGLGVDYSLSPEAVYPTALSEIDRVYRMLLEEGRDPRNIFLLGDSAGANLALASACRWRDRATPMPAGVILFSPAIDAAFASDTTVTLHDHDPSLSEIEREAFGDMYALYAPGFDVLHPEISPIYADFRDFPPMLIHVGSREVLLGDAARLSEYARRAETNAVLRVFDGMFHLFHMNWQIEDARHAHDDAANFIAQHGLARS